MPLTIICVFPLLDFEISIPGINFIISIKVFAPLFSMKSLLITVTVAGVFSRLSFFAVAISLTSFKVFKNSFSISSFAKRKIDITKKIINFFINFPIMKMCFFKFYDSID